VSVRPNTPGRTAEGSNRCGSAPLLAPGAILNSHAGACPERRPHSDEGLDRRQRLLFGPCRHVLRQSAGPTGAPPRPNPTASPPKPAWRRVARRGPRSTLPANSDRDTRFHRRRRQAFTRAARRRRQYLLRLDLPRATPSGVTRDWPSAQCAYPPVRPPRSTAAGSLPRYRATRLHDAAPARPSSFNVVEKFTGKVVSSATLRHFDRDAASRPSVDRMQLVALILTTAAPLTAGRPCQLPPCVPDYVPRSRCVVGYSGTLFVEAATGVNAALADAPVRRDEHWPLYREPHLLATLFRLARRRSNSTLPSDPHPPR
jgi:hypothetical protein